MPWFSKPSRAFRDRRCFPGALKWPAEGERRVAWREGALSGRFMAMELVAKSGLLSDPPDGEQGESYEVTAKEILEASERDFPEVKSQLKELVKAGCDGDYVCRTCRLLAQLPLNAWSSRSLPRRPATPFQKAAEVATTLRSMAATHRLGSYNKRELWLLERLPILLELSVELIDRVRQIDKETPAHFYRDIAIVIFVDHIEEKTGKINWETVASLIGLYNPESRLANHQAVRKAHQRGCRQLEG